MASPHPRPPCRIFGLRSKRVWSKVGVENHPTRTTRGSSEQEEAQMTYALLPPISSYLFNDRPDGSEFI